MKGFNNRILIILLLVLVAAFVLTRVFRSPALESNLNNDLFTVDTAAITAIRLYPAAGQNEITLVLQDKNWRVSRDNKTADAERSGVKNLLATLTQLKVQRMTSRKKEKWNNYDVGDSTAIQLIALADADELLNLRIGKQQGTSTYVRLGEEEEVYEVTGLLRTTIDKNFDDWRDKSFLRTHSDAITKITFNYPADSGFVAEKKDNIWMIANEKADSASIENYLNKLRSKDIDSFADDFKPAGDADIAVTIESGTNPPVTIRGWRQSFYQWVLSSSQHPDTYFSDEGPVMTKELFPSKKTFLNRNGQ